MSLRLRPYPKMKDSGVPWLGEIPAHWQVLRQRNAVHMLVSNVDKHTKEEEIPVRLCNYVNVYKNERISQNLRFMRATASAEEIDRFRLRLGDVIITKDSEAWDDIGVPALVQYAAADLICGYHLAILRPRDGVVLGAFLLRALQSQGVASQYFVAANGVTRYGLSHDGIKSVFLPIPPLPEQSAIVRFLDHADKRIKRCIAAKRRLIELLNEQKQAIIQKAVTRGLDPTVRLKPSGLDWLGSIPSSWRVLRNHRIFSERNERGREGLPILVVSLNTGVTAGSEVDEAGRPKRLIEDRTLYKFAAEGDIAYNMMRMWQGAVGVVPTDGLVSPAYVVVRSSQEINPKYFELLFRTPAYRNEINRNSRGIVTDRNRLYWEDFKGLPSPVPPKAIQDVIVDYVDRETTEIQRAIERTNKEIDLVREYRTRLIADVVTGKLDVRGVELPEWEEPEDLPALADEAINEPPEEETELEPVEEGADGAD